MAKDIIGKYIWIIETILKHGRISKSDLSELWGKSRFSQGDPMADRTFYKYRRAIEENFNISIQCDSMGYYYIGSGDSPFAKRYADWILDNNMAADAIKTLGTASGRIEMEEVPSAREFLPVVTYAMNNNRKIVFTYAGFSRVRPEVGILFAPYFLKLYKQRWYMYGEKDGGDYRTYALDRVTEMEITENKFRMPKGTKSSDVFGSIIGVTATKGAVRNVVIQTNPTRAKYLRALPLHVSQKEELHDFYSIFHYRLKLNYELVSELMAMGPEVTVIAPRELQLMMVERLQGTLENYSFLYENK